MITADQLFVHAIGDYILQSASRLLAYVGTRRPYVLPSCNSCRALCTHLSANHYALDRDTYLPLHRQAGDVPSRPYSHVLRLEILRTRFRSMRTPDHKHPAFHFAGASRFDARFPSLGQGFRYATWIGKLCIWPPSLDRAGTRQGTLAVYLFCMDGIHSLFRPLIERASEIP